MSFGPCLLILPLISRMVIARCLCWVEACALEEFVDGEWVCECFDDCGLLWGVRPAVVIVGGRGCCCCG